MINSLDNLNNRFELTKGKKKKERMKKSEHSLQDIINSNNKNIMRALEYEKGKGEERIFEKVVTKNIWI